MIQRRNIVVWYLVSIVTLQLAWIVWYFKVHADAKNLALGRADLRSRARFWSPWKSVLAITLGGVLIVPIFVSLGGTWSRVRKGTRSRAMAAGKQFLFTFVPLVNIAYMGILQSELNKAAAKVQSGAAVSSSASGLRL